MSDLGIEKEQRARKLLTEDMFTEICKMKRYLLNEIPGVYKESAYVSNETNKKIINKSLCSQAFDCFLKKMPLARIVIYLDLEPRKLIGFCRELLLLLD